ncbi:MAG: histidinol dehydrogenase [Chitinophagaceae bacterium]|nr:histidinol dehydrogenase [Chitinophagaceae bacterium]
MKMYAYPDIAEWNTILKRPATEKKFLQKTVRQVLKKVKKNGDKAVIKFTHAFDGVLVNSLRVSEEEITTAASKLTDELKEAIQVAKKNIEKFHTAQKEPITITETMPGITCWRQSVAIEKVGLYIPGGTAPLFSTVLMLAIPAQLAGCKEIILCTPPQKDGSVHPAILYTASLCGATAVYRCGGAQAIAAIAYGTESIPAVQKIFGPGNQYVTVAKQMVQLDGVAIDIPAGPSEVLVIADHTAIPGFVAADLLSQAEHGPDSQVVLISTNKKTAGLVLKSIKEQLKTLPRKGTIKQALKYGRIVIVGTLNDAVAISNRYAPEHLILCCEDAGKVAGEITAAGSVFIGNYSPESAGDYASGTNHTLPTGGFSVSHSGVSLDSYIKKISFQQLTEEGLANIGQTVMTMAEAEGLDAHKRAVEIRLNN